MLARRRRPIARDRDGTYRIELNDEVLDLLADLAGQLDPLLDDPSADPGLRRLFPPAHPEDLVAEAAWQIERGDDLRDSRRRALDVVRTARGGHLSEGELVAWMQGVNGLRLVLAERLGVDGDDNDDEQRIDRLLAVIDDDAEYDEVRDAARAQLATWQVYELLGSLVAHAVRALD